MGKVESKRCISKPWPPPDTLYGVLRTPYSFCDTVNSTECYVVIYTYCFMCLAACRLDSSWFVGQKKRIEPPKFQIL